jgi:hypothetical protein
MTASKRIGFATRDDVILRGLVPSGERERSHSRYARRLRRRLQRICIDRQAA